MDLREKFLKIYPNIPDKLRNDIIVVIDKKSYTWNVVYLEITDNTALGKKMLKILEEMKIL